VTELLEGETLRERLTHGAIALRKAVEYGVQIARGLAAAHERGIVHRDLKPENLFVTKDGRVKILDFGLAKLLPAKDDRGLTAKRTRETDPGVVLGTAGYMAPEQVRGRPADHRADIFAFGTILYEMVTGRQSFRKPTSAETMTAILHEEPQPISLLAPRVSPGLQRVVHRCLEKSPQQRFQSASDLAFALEALSDSGIVSTSSAKVIKKRRTRRLWMAAGGAAVLLAFPALLSYRLMRQDRIPRVTQFVQLTHDGLPKVLGGTDGSRLYLFGGRGWFGARSYGFQGDAIAEMSVNGGEARRLSNLPEHMYPRALSSNGREVLLAEVQGSSVRSPLWSMPVLGGSLRRLGDTRGQDAAWSPDDNMMAYGDGSNLMVAKADGSEPRRIARLNDSEDAMKPVWSPDQSHLRFTRLNRSTHISSIWEISIDGKNLHRLLPDWTSAPADSGRRAEGDCCGHWTADGKYFIFQAQEQLWALPRSGMLGSAAKPVQLTFSPMSLSAPIPSADGKSLFCIGSTKRGELRHYDVKAGQFAPYLGGISAEYPAFSKDGQWVAYVSFPEGILWRSKVDGSERRQLTFPPDYAMLPRWSPDGQTILFSAVAPDRTIWLSLISREGGSPKPLLPNGPQPQKSATWSADGGKIAFGGNSRDPESLIRILDVASSQVTTIPGSQGLYSPRWSPEGRFLAALSGDLRRVMLFDFQKKQWTALATTGTLNWPAWSHDSRFLYFLEGNEAGNVVRIRLSDHKLERLTDLKNLVTTGYYGGALALTPDDSPLLMRDAGTYDVYATNWNPH
jgi:Tol biopolymer transport system component